jgi:hypothetical protein
MPRVRLLLSLTPGPRCWFMTSLLTSLTLPPCPLNVHSPHSAKEVILLQYKSEHISLLKFVQGSTAHPDPLFSGPFKVDYLPLSPPPSVPTTQSPNLIPLLDTVSLRSLWLILSCPQVWAQKQFKHCDLFLNFYINYHPPSLFPLLCLIFLYNPYHLTIIYLLIYLFPFVLSPQIGCQKKALGFFCFTHCSNPWS